ncbi:OpgC family protein [Pseudogemmobacter humi]|uniref:OpgC protein n=1 Tax=Pseudogemmobacter humi TaxID=2483812 RepID=A0A3P5X7X4_9RHOB|nr:OpgC domain-containing protein [Pseudogemmobacter humi]VDC24519.1 OpgC protein [Pseudogemmobacter humi]
MSHETVTVKRRERDLRLDFFRGLAMIVILFAHITDNPWTLWLPGRFGFSDSTEIFVFCSGMASALAYGVIFHRAGWLTGTGRILYRIWQVYWVHLGIFFVALLSMLALNMTGAFPRDEVGALNLYPFLRNTGSNFFGLMTLTYVPNYFDILPMYIVLLALVPCMIALARIDTRLPLLASLMLWLLGTSGSLWIPAEWWFVNGSTRPWFFNPFAWQLVFFTGFALMSGWLPAPPLRRDLVWLAVGILIATVPFAWYVTIGRSEFLQTWRREWLPLYDKTGFGLLRYVHFLALAYLAWTLAGPAGARLKQFAAHWPRAAGMVIDIGKQSLAVFAVSMVLARVLGAVLKLLGPGWIVTPAINLTGLFLIWATARLVGWVKGQSWKKHLDTPRAPAELPAAGVVIGETGPLAPVQGVKP